MTTRREFLQAAALGAGALTVGSSLYGSPAPNTPPRRFVLIRKSNGVRPTEVALPTFSESEAKADKDRQPLTVDLANHEFPAWLRGLDAYKSHVGIVQGLSCKMSENGHWSYSSVLGAYKSGRNSLSGIKRATIDFELAQLFPSPFGHVELSLTGNYSTFRTGIVPGYSAPAPHQRNYCYADPQTAHDELFKTVTAPASVDSDNAMLAFLQGEESFRAEVLKGYEQRKLSDHVRSIEAIQERNRKLERMSGTLQQHLPTLDPVHAGGGRNATTPEKQRAMTDVLIGALAAGLTNVVTYTIDELSTPIRGLRGNEGDRISIHELGHNGGYSGVPSDVIREQIRIGHVEQIVRIVEGLKAVPEGDGSVFDNTTILYFPENGEGHHSQGTEAPFVVVAGDNCNLDVLGRYTRLPYHGSEGHKTIGNWYTTLLNAHGNPIEHYGDLDLEMSRKKLYQTGAIQQFLRQG